jgi:hypothetical protein
LSHTVRDYVNHPSRQQTTSLIRNHITTTVLRWSQTCGIFFVN